MNELKIFENQEFGKVRVVMKDSEPWFVGKDVSETLGYSNTKDAIIRHVDEEDRKILKAIDFTQKSQNATFEIPPRGLTIINESGLYALIISSKLPTAKKFKHWVTSEVLPSIRKNGAYIAGQETMTNEELIAKALVAANNIIAERERRIASMQARLDEQNAAISVMKPKAEYHDNVLAADGTLVTTVIAKEFGMTAANLNRLLHQYHVQYKIGGIWVLYAEHQDQKYQKTETTYTETPYGRKARTWTHWTQEGRKFIHDTLREHGILPLNER